jgi:hypothetical protein
MKGLKQTVLWLVLMLFALSECGEPSFFFPENVYVVGLGATGGQCGGAIWRNQETAVFTDLDRCSNLIDINLTGGHGVAVHNGDILVAGQSLQGPAIIKNVQATLWRNGVGELLPNWNAAVGIAKSICVAGDDIYIAGLVSANGLLPLLWKNGTPDTLKRIWPQTAGWDNHYEAVAVYGNGISVAVAGVKRSIGLEESTAMYWLDGEPVIVESLDGFGNSTAFDVVMLGHDVYVVGMIHEKPYYDYPNGSYMAALWKNGKLTTLADDGVARGIAVRGDDVYVVGSVGWRPVYWFNGEVHELSSPEDNPGSAMAIYIREGNIFIANGGGYWRNGLFYKLSDTFLVRDIIAMPY